MHWFGILHYHLNLFLSANLPDQTNTAVCPENPRFFVLPPWWEYLPQHKDVLGQCVADFKFPDDIFPVGLAILDMLTRLIGFAAVVSIIIAGIEYVFAIGTPDKITAARKRIQNALIGVVIASVAVALVTFIGRYFS